jgi:hypothetical protein
MIKNICYNDSGDVCYMTDGKNMWVWVEKTDGTREAIELQIKLDEFQKLK